MKTALFGVMFACAIGTTAMANDADVMKQLAPTGKLRVGIAYAPRPTPTFAAKDATGEVRGVPRDIGDALARSLGVPVELTATATTNELTDKIVAGDLDVGFMPADDERRKRMDFSPPYFMIRSTFLAGGNTGIKTYADVDKPEITVVGINGSTTIRAAGRALTVAKIVPAKSVDEAMEMMKAGSVQAFALTHDSLPPLQQQLPGSRILDGAFQTTGVAIAVQKDRPAALAYVTAFVDKAKIDSTVRKALDAVGLTTLPIAP